VMVAALPLILGVQLLLSWLGFDVAAEPRHPVHALLWQKETSINVKDCGESTSGSPKQRTKISHV